MAQPPETRLPVLRSAAAEWLGEWTTSRVQSLYTARFGPGPWRRPARADLTTLHRQGLLTLHDEVSARRFYTVNLLTKGGS